MVEAMMEYFTTLSSYLRLNVWDILQTFFLIGIYSKLEGYLRFSGYYK